MYKILMLEDDQFLLFQYTDILKDYGFNVDSTTQVKEFYLKATENDYDAIISDINLSADGFLSDIESAGGWRTGLAICKKIRLNGSDAKIIALTNSTLPEAVEWFSQDESVAYFNKYDYPPLEFAIALKQILNNPDYTFCEFDEAETLRYKLLSTRHSLDEVDNDELLSRLDLIIDALENNNTKSFLSYVDNFISFLANTSTILSTVPTLKKLVLYLSNLL